MNDSISDELNCLISKMLKPLRGVSLNVILEGLCGYKIIPFDKNDEKDIALLEKLKTAADIAGKNINADGIMRSRPNEVGNAVEPFVKNALNEVGLISSTPLTQSGIRKASGYPDIEFIDQFKRLNYLECKTFNVDIVDSTQRSFFISPSDDFKITVNAHHFLISFGMFVCGKNGVQNIFKCKGWKLITLENLLCNIKYEFNSSNKVLYSPELLLAEGKCRL